MTTTADTGNGSLRSVIANASNNDTITFGVSDATITLTSGVIQSGLNLTIAANAGQNITISGNNASQIFNFTNSSGSVNETINNLVFTDGNNTGGDGGAIFAKGTLSLSNDTFSYNQAWGRGGAVSVQSFTGSADSLTVTASKFNNNSAGGYGGAIASPLSANGENITINSSSFTSNAASHAGGAIAATGSSTTTLTINSGSSFVSNKVTGSGSSYDHSGGAIDTMDQLTVNATTAAITFSNNYATDGGGAINYHPASGSSSMSLTNVTFSSDTASFGGAVNSIVNTNQGTVTINVNGSTFNNNQATGADQQTASGGALFLNHTTSNTGSASVTITNSTFFQNIADEYGGGIAVQLNNSGTGANAVALTSLTIYQNGASTQGGGLWVSLTGTGTSTANVQLDNSIIAGDSINNPPSDGTDVFFTNNGGNGTYIQFISQGYNFIGIWQSTGNSSNTINWSSSDYVGTPSSPLVPALDPNGLQYNGGLTQTIKALTTANNIYRNGDPRLLTSNSPLNKDQRGLTRTTYVTIGAYDPDAT